MALTLMPPPAAGAACLPFAQHFTRVLLRPGAALQLGKVAVGALTLLLTRAVEYGEANPQLVSASSPAPLP